MVPGRTATCTYVLFLEPNTDELVWKPILYTVLRRKTISPLGLTNAAIAPFPTDGSHLLSRNGSVPILHSDTLPAMSN